ncbi:hypothetical protein Verru16b_00430 [Lacunisphaera limnophila]|uniref:C4-dicarboxylate anaerobic carrier n=1 Tax=Lacunisphaera limnophila TaxID=1838286 RepID=A0A1D8AR77_9BACT|nr:YfcC family protein [Lacunisphaera limnophila]AOS43387.1 hypothetical protein Verru16b_00430 [Lacunisphaera limnophila]
MTPASAPRAPDALLIVLVVLLAAIGLTWVVPAGEFERGQSGSRTVVVPGTYRSVEAQPVSWHAVFTAPMKGFSDKDAAQIIGFVLLIGGAFAVINATGAISAGIHRLVRLAGDSPGRRRLIIPMLMIAFSIGGNTFGMSEEVLVFILITIPLARRLGWDAIVGTAIPFVGAGVGFAGAAFNPFTVGIAQGISELPLFSGWPLRMALWAVLTAVAILYVMRYAARIEGRPPAPSAGDASVVAEEPLTARRAGVLALLGAGILLLVWGVTKWDWYIVEIAGLFLAIGIGAAFVGGLGANPAAQAFASGARDMVTAVVVIGLSRSVLLVMQEGRIVDTLLHAASQAVGGLPAVLSVQVMFAVQFGLNFVVPSGSGQAALTMPIMAPLSDLLHIPRQAAVLAFQLGDGFSNFVMPTSGVTMGVLSIARIPFGTWLRWVGWLLVWLVAIGMAFLALGVTVVRW